MKIVQAWVNRASILTRIKHQILYWRDCLTGVAVLRREIFHSLDSLSHDLMSDLDVEDEITEIERRLDFDYVTDSEHRELRDTVENLETDMDALKTEVDDIGTPGV